MEFLVATVLKKVEMGIYYIILSSLVFLAIGIDTLTIYIYMNILEEAYSDVGGVKIVFSILPLWN